MLFPWVSAILWTAFSKGFILSSLLLLGAVWNLFQKRSYPFSWNVMTALLQIGWLAAAYYTNTPFITIGMCLQLVALSYMTAALTNEKNKYKYMIANYEQQTVLLYELRQQRHDFHNQLDAVQYSVRYKERLQNHYNELDNLLRSESNVAAGALFNYHQRAEEKGIALQYHIQQPLSRLPLREDELISLIGNILTNALEAAEQYEMETGMQSNIIFTCRKQSGNYIIVCQNSTVPLKNDTLERIFTRKSRSTKGGEHEGLGTQQVSRIIKKYNGNLDFAATNQKFTLTMKIPDVR